MLNVGDNASDFELSSHLEKGKALDLRDKNVVIAFYPLDWI
jgi:peroxiredoxin